MILAVNHVQITIPPGAEEEARQFYCGILGLREIPKPESLKSRGGFWLELKDFQIHIGLEEDVERSRSKVHIAYEVDDLNEWQKKLANNGITIIPGDPIPHYHRFEFRDPFGNRIEFLEQIKN